MQLIIRDLIYRSPHKIKMSNHLLSVTKTKYGIGHIPIAQSVLAHCFILQTPYLLPENYFIHHRPTVMNQFNHTSELFSSLK